MAGRVVIMGAGPAGLAAAYVLAKAGRPAVVFEASPTVGGISRTINYKGYYFDLGGHRFFTKFTEVQKLWEEVLGQDFVVRPRLSRIYYGGKFYDYPLKASNALGNLGVVEATRCMLSYGMARLAPPRDAANLEDWVSSRFGERLFQIFFKTYTEKVWGIPCTEIGAEWAGQRIKNLSLGKAVWNALFGNMGKDKVTSLIEQFHYPRRGPGMMYDRMAELVRERGGAVEQRAPVVAVERDGFRVRAVQVKRADGQVAREEGSDFISSIPLTLLVEALRPAAPDSVLAAARALTFRHLLTIDLIVARGELFPDNWIYIHAPELLVGRIQNFGNWSPDMVPDPKTSSLGLEYFCSDGDRLWNMTEAQLVELGSDELRRTGLLPEGARIVDGTIVRVPRAYPVYRIGYEKHLETVVDYIRRFENLQPVGRYGMFKYNNADHSIMTALLAVENIDGARHDIWAVNTDSEYHEIRRPDAATVSVPPPAARPPADQARPS